jgi:hypothetical protein
MSGCSSESSGVGYIFGEDGSPSIFTDPQDLKRISKLLLGDVHAAPGMHIAARASTLSQECTDAACIL